MNLIKSLFCVAILPFFVQCFAIDAKHKSQNNIDEPYVRFGIIADIQYCDCDVNGSRYYRSSLQKLDECVESFNRKSVQFTVNLGDLVDKDTPNNLDSVLIRLSQLNASVYNLTGNHDYGNVDNDRLYKLLNMPAEYYSFTMRNWRFIMLNTNEIASYSNTRGTWKENELSEMIDKFKEAKGKAPASYNGGISSKQIQWLRQLLEKSENKGENVLVFSHHPLDCVTGLTALNGSEVLSLISQYNCVKAVIAGHHHDGFFCNTGSLPNIVLEGMVETANQNSYGIIDLFPDKLVLHGYGRMTSRVIQF